MPEDMVGPDLPTGFNPLQTPQPLPTDGALLPAGADETSVAESLCRMSRSASAATGSSAGPASVEAAAAPALAKRSVTRSHSGNSGKKAKVGGKRA